MYIHTYTYTYLRLQFPRYFELAKKKKKSEKNMRILEILYGVHVLSKPE